jgi:molybdenum cofactor guanylyltransferase
VRAGAVVLAGGRSSRMGRPKALLEWDGRTAVEHAVAVARTGVRGGPVCLVRARGQELPSLEALVVEDPVSFAGPLAALTEGLAALDGRCEVAFACGVDTPLLAPELVRVVVAALRYGDDAVVPVIAGRAQPLLAAYRVSLVSRLRELLAQGRSGLKDVPEAAAVRSLTEAELLASPELAAADPELRSALNANTPEEWAALRDGTPASG